MENIRFGKASATDTEVIDAAKLAMAHEFIQLFPDGYQTIVGERGVTVSGSYAVSTDCYADSCVVDFRRPTATHCHVNPCLRPLLPSLTLCSFEVLELC